MFSVNAAPIVSYGELLWDLFPDGERLGGCAGNVAFHLAQLGRRAALVTRVGRDERGERARRVLAEAGVDTSGVQEDPTRATGVVRVRLVDGEPRFSIVEEAAWDRIVLDDATRALLDSATAVVFGTLAQRTPVGSKALDEALATCAPSCVRVLDLNARKPFADREIIARSIGQANVVKLNASEAKLLAETFRVSDVPRWLVEEQRVSVAALTLGVEGSVLVTRDDRVSHVSRPAGSGGDAVGAGDAFTAVLALGLSEGWPIDRIGCAANRYAGWVASRRGATPVPPRDLVEEVLATP